MVAMKSRAVCTGVLALLVAAAGCGGSEGGSSAAGGAASAPGTALTEEQMELGVGPVTSVELGEIDAALASRGEGVFALKCSACHKVGERYVGPALGAVLTRRRPEYVMNMILNPAEMLEKHPTARELLGQFMTPMPDQNLTEDEARAVLEYLRSVQVDSVAAVTGSE